MMFGIASLTATNRVPKTTIPTSTAAILIAITARPSLSSMKNIVPIAIKISTSIAIPFDNGGSPAVFSIESTSVSWNTRFVIFPASLAKMKPTNSITIIERNSPRYFIASSSQSILNICCG